MKELLRTFIQIIIIKAQFFNQLKEEIMMSVKKSRDYLILLRQKNQILTTYLIINKLVLE
jgi:hypothetical protein